MPKVLQKSSQIYLLAKMGTLIPIQYLLYGSHISPSREVLEAISKNDTAKKVPK